MTICASLLLPASSTHAAAVYGPELEGFEYPYPVERVEFSSQQQPLSMAYGMYAGLGKEIVAWNQAQTADMLFTQPVVHDFPNIQAPTLLLIGGKDRTAPGSNRAPEAVAKKLGHYTQLGRKTAEAIPNATLVEFPELGHSPQVEAPEVFHKALLQGLDALEQSSKAGKAD